MVFLMLGAFAAPLNMVSHFDQKKRKLVTLLLKLARKYKLDVQLNRGSEDNEVQAVFRPAIRWAHPDKRGSPEDVTSLPGGS